MKPTSKALARLGALLVFCGTALAAGVAQAQDLTIAAASDLQAVMPQVVTRFEQATGRSVRVAYGSSGNFFAQIRNGAPFDLFFSADIDYPRQLVAASLADADTLTRYAVGRIVIWTPKGSSIDLRQGLAALTAPSVRRIAIANPEHAPYGRAAVAALRSAAVYERAQSKLVLGENISQAAQFVQSGNADVGILALSIALTPTLAEQGTYVEIPSSTYPAIEQGAVVIRASTRKDAARAFLTFLRQPEIVALLQRFGFQVPATPGH